MSNGDSKKFSKQFYPFLHTQESNSLEDVLADVKVSTLKKCADVVALRQQVITQYADELVRCAQAMARAFADGKKLLAFGNGGSATDAQDVAADCMLRGLPALSLTNDIGVVTAVGNDVGFENVFMRQVIAFGKAGDIAFGISTSGNSRNVEMAFEQAHKQGLLTIGLAGYDGGKAAALQRAGAVDFCFVAPSTYVPRIQEAHATIYHTLIELTGQMLSEQSTVNGEQLAVVR
ncbi:MAG: SIS domain-containing protein [Chloroflexi bacterium]|nr:SIS domain-containing protein [Chloroflexota bacterium]